MNSASDVVLDSSVLLAYLQREKGAETVLFLLERAVMSSVNLAEVRTRLIDLGERAVEAAEPVLQLVRRIEPFTEEDALTASSLRKTTSHAGLSLGDRACLALGITLGAEVYTADKVWSKLGDVGCKIHMLR